MYERLLHPMRVHDQLRILVYRGDRFAGWVGLLRTESQPRFRRADARRLAPLVEPISTALVRADAIEQAERPEEGCDLFVRCDGVVEYASAAGRRWLQHEHARERLRHWMKVLEREEESPPPHLDGRPVRWTRLYGQGQTRYLLHLAPPAPVRRSPLSRLSSSQREVAELAARGATAQEIARMLNRSPETVRTHLREIYRRLEVSTRAELARQLATG